MVVPALRSSRNVPIPEIEPTVTVKLVPLAAETLATVPPAMPVVVTWKSAGTTLYTVSLKTTVKARLVALVGPGVLGVLERTAGGVCRKVAVPPDV